MSASECFAPLQHLFCCHFLNRHLKAYGFAVGWLGFIIRTAGLTLFAVLLHNVTEYDPKLYEVIFAVFLSYFAVTLTAAIFLLAGITWKRTYLILPYMVVIAFEVFLYLFLIIACNVLVQQIEEALFISAIIPTGLALLGVHYVFWLVLYRLYMKWSDDTITIALQTQNE